MSAKFCFSTPEAEGFSPELAARLDQMTENDLAIHRIACADLLVARHNKVVYYKQHGYADVESGRLLGTDGLFRLASMSKPVAAVATMMMQERGKLSIEDKVSKYVPEFAHMRVVQYDAENHVITGSEPANRELTLHDLLTHSGGIGSGESWEPQIDAFEAWPGDTLESMVPRYAETLLEYHPGTKSSYSGKLAFDTLARIVELTSDMPYNDFLQKNLCGPLGMENTIYTPTPEQEARLVSVYATTDSGLEKVDMGEYNFAHCPRSYHSGGAGLLGCVPDYYRFASMLYNGGALDGVRILSEETVRAMQTPQLPPQLPGTDPNFTWGLGMRLVLTNDGWQKPLQAGTYGWSGAYGTHFWIDPVNDIVAVYMSNMTTAGGAGAVTAREFEQAVMESLPKA